MMGSIYRSKRTIAPLLHLYLVLKALQNESLLSVAHLWKRLSLECFLQRTIWSRLHGLLMASIMAHLQV